MDNKENLKNFEVLVHGVQNLNINVNSESSLEELGTRNNNLKLFNLT